MNEQRRDLLGNWARVAVLLAPIVAVCIWGLTAITELKTEVAVLKSQVSAVDKRQGRVEDTVNRISINQDRMMGAMGVKPITIIPQPEE